MGQKYQRYDLVRIAKDLGPHMKHFIAGKRAIIEHSYNDAHGHDEGKELGKYSVFIEGEGSFSWYHESQLEHLETNRRDLYVQWIAELNK